MEIVWDAAKAAQNVVNHGVRFVDAVLVLEDPYAVTIADEESSPDESRWVTLGADALGRVLVVFIPTAAKTFGSFLPAARNRMNATSMGRNDENLRL